MQEYVCIKFRADSEEQQERLVALLADAGFDGFEQEESELKAFIKKEMFDHSFSGNLRNNLPADYSLEIIPEENWNAKWESAFQPVIIGDTIAIRADFHPPVQKVKHVNNHHKTSPFGTKNSVRVGCTGVTAAIIPYINGKKVFANPDRSGNATY